MVSFWYWAAKMEPLQPLGPNPGKSFTNFIWKQPVHQVAFTDENDFVAFSSDKSIHAWCTRDNVILGEPLQLSDDVVHLRFDPSGQFLIAVTEDKQVSMISVGTELQQLYEIPCRFFSTSEYSRPFLPKFVDDGKVLMVQSDREFLRFYEVESGELIDELRLTKHTNTISISPRRKNSPSWANDSYPGSFSLSETLLLLPIRSQPRRLGQKLKTETADEVAKMADANRPQQTSRKSQHD